MTVHDKDRILSVAACRTYPVSDPADDGKTIDLRLEEIIAAQCTTALVTPEIERG